ncbi:hypothetical protein T08_10855 [Trichinella sp. T8]|nr:hypothetical protein T08_10855 [Trichinella sp. T8]
MIIATWRSSGTSGIFEFPLMLAASIHTPHRCFIILSNCQKVARNNKYHGPSTDLHSHEVLDYASMKADILHIQTSLDKLTSLEQAPGIAELLCRKPTSPSHQFVLQN